MGKLNLIHAKGNSFFFDGIFSIGLYLKEKTAILIDSGISKDTTKEICKYLSENQMTVEVIINTHCHGDHCGGNAYLQQKFPEIKIYSTETERPFIEDPLLAPICFCCGAAAFEDIKKCKPITPQQPSKVTHVISPYKDQTLTLCDESFEIIALPGHTRGMIGVKTPDNVLYCGDAIFGGDTFKKHPILFYTFIQDTLNSFKKLKALSLQIEAAVTYHGGLVSNLISLIEDHETRILETKQMIFSFLKKTPLSLEALTAKVMQKNGIPDDLIAYTLTKTPVQAYLAELEREGKVEIYVKEGIAQAQVIASSLQHPSHEHPQAML